jgi:hypothetical protein
LDTERETETGREMKTEGHGDIGKEMETVGEIEMWRRRDMKMGGGGRWSQRGNIETMREMESLETEREMETKKKMREEKGGGEGGRRFSARPTPFYSRLLARYFKTT